MNIEQILLPNLFLDDLKEAVGSLIKEKCRKEDEYEKYKKSPQPFYSEYSIRYERLIKSYELAIEVMKLKIKEIEEACAAYEYLKGDNNDNTR